MAKNFPNHILSVSVAIADKPGRVNTVLTIYPGSQNASVRTFWPSGEERAMQMISLDQLVIELRRISDG
jgi:hypothetical protein